MFDPDDDELANKSVRQGEILFNDGVSVNQKNIAPKSNLIVEKRQDAQNLSKDDQLEK